MSATRTIQQCKNCGLDITDIVHIECDVCTDLRLCAECFAQGAEFDSHKNDHNYCVIELPDFPICDANWTAEEELLLLEGIELNGMGNWLDISEHIATKNVDQTRGHYLSCYINSPLYPLPWTDQTFTPEQVEQLKKRRKEERDNWKPAEKISTKPSGKPLTSQPSNHEVGGFMPLREEFETEHENDAESIISALGFQDDDTPEETELKLKMLEIYNWKLERRLERRHFILDRGLVNYKHHQGIDKRRTKEERDLCVSHRPFARFQTSPDFELFMDGILNERKIRNKIDQLKSYRRSGITSLVEVEYLEGDKKKEAEQKKSKESQYYYDRQPTSRRVGRERDDVVVVGKGAGRKALITDLIGAEGAQLLSPKEYEFCAHLKLQPRAYIFMKETIIRECNEQGFLKRSQVKNFIRADVNKTAKVYDFLLAAGWIRAQPIQANSHNNNNNNPNTNTNNMNTNNTNTNNQTNSPNPNANDNDNNNNSTVVNNVMMTV